MNWVTFIKRLFAISMPAGAILAVLCLATLPQPVAAANTSTFEVSGWLPDWRVATSSADVIPHLNKLTEINPFGYNVKNNGTLSDPTGISSATSSWATVIKDARMQNVRVIPTVMWSDTDAIDTVLSSTTLRTQNVNSIVAMVKQNNFDGVDIDYEGKKASDEQYFSTFLGQLSTALGNKSLDCTIEARTPPQDLNTNTPISQFQYANDLTQINKYCYRVRIMTYDQDSVDKTLNAQAGNSIYAPIADIAWDTAVIQLMEKSISPSKIELGVATYGYEYNVTPYANHTGYIYNLLWAFNPKYATQIATSLGITPMRDKAGELAFTYTPTTTPAMLPSGASSAAATNPNQTATALQAVVTGNVPLSGTVRYVTWSDSVAIAQKVALAKQLGLRGIAIFKLDGGEDQNIWNVIP